MSAVDLSGDRFLIEQPLTAWVNRYRVTRDDGSLVAFCEQKRFALREDLRVFADETRAVEILRIKARRVVDIGGRYDVTDPDGAPIGALGRQARTSLLRTTWVILDGGDAVLATARERSLAVAIVRRVQNGLLFVPLVGWMLDLAIDLIPIPYHFDLFDGATPIGRFSRRLGFRDRYVLELDDGGRIDRRLALAMGVALDALQSR